MITCSVCGEELHIGQHPFCPHGYVRGAYAQAFSPIVIHVSPTGEYRFPGSTDAAVPEGYRKVELRTIQEADRVTREVNAREDETLRSVQHQSETSRSLTRTRNRAFMDHIRAGGRWVSKDEHGREVVRHGLSQEAKQYLDRAREYVALKDRERVNPRSTNAHFEVFSHDSSNREGHADERTGWKNRKA